jgi:REP element-mobilizing transposase RayT
MQGVVHVTQKLRPGLPGLRQRAEIEVVREALRAGNECPGFRVVAFSAMNNHLHLGIEVRSTAELSHGMQGLAIRLAKA